MQIRSRTTTAVSEWALPIHQEIDYRLETWLAKRLTKAPPKTPPHDLSHFLVRQVLDTAVNRRKKDDNFPYDIAVLVRVIGVDNFEGIGLFQGIGQLII